MNNSSHPSEARMLRRIDVDLPARIGSVPATVNDLSQLGIGFQTPSRPAFIEPVVTLEGGANEEPLSLKVDVLWVSGPVEGGRYRVGGRLLHDARSRFALRSRLIELCVRKTREESHPGE